MVFGSRADQFFMKLGKTNIEILIISRQKILPAWKLHFAQIHKQFPLTGWGPPPGSRCIQRCSSVLIKTSPLQVLLSRSIPKFQHQFVHKFFHPKRWHSASLDLNWIGHKPISLDEQQGSRMVFEYEFRCGGLYLRLLKQFWPKTKHDWSYVITTLQAGTCRNI